MLETNYNEILSKEMEELTDITSGNNANLTINNNNKNNDNNNNGKNNNDKNSNI